MGNNVNVKTSGMVQKSRVEHCANCNKHEFQDATYGFNRRVMNMCKPTVGGHQKYRCTVCGTIYEFGKG